MSSSLWAVLSVGCARKSPKLQQVRQSFDVEHESDLVLVSRELDEAASTNALR